MSFIYERIATKGFAVFLILAAILAVLVLVPIGQLLASSFQTAPLGKSGPYSMDNYVQVLSQPRYYGMLLNSVILAVGTSLLSVCLGVPLAWIVARTNTPAAETLEKFIVLPLTVTPFIGALAWIILLSPKMGMINLSLMNLFGMTEAPFNIYSMPGMIFVLGLYFTPYVFLFTSSSLKSMDPSLEEASAVLGGGHIRTLLRVTFPLNLPAILSAGTLILVLSIEMFGAPALLGVPAGIYVLPTQIYAYLSYFPPRYGQATVTGVILLFITVSLIYLQRKIISQRRFVTITGKGYRPRLMDLGGARYLTLGICLCYVILSVVLPIFTLLLRSLLPYYEPGFSLNILTSMNYNLLFNYSIFLNSIRNSLILAATGATIIVLITFVIGYIAYRTQILGRAILEYLAMIPIAVPSIVLAIALLWIYVGSPIGIYGTVWILLVAYITRYIPYGVRSVSSTVLQVHEELEETSRILGANMIRTLISIVLPLVKLGLVSGWILLFMLLSRELSASILLYTPGNEVLSVAIFDLVENGEFGPACALTIIQMMIILIPLVVIMKKGGKVAFA